MKKFVLIYTIILILSFNGLSSNPKFFIYDSTNTSMEVNEVLRTTFNKNDNTLWFNISGFKDSTYITNLFSYNGKNFNNYATYTNLNSMRYFTIDSSNMPWVTYSKKDTNIGLIARYDGNKWISYESDTWNLFYELKTDCYGNIIACAYHSLMIFDKNLKLIQNFSPPTIPTSYVSATCNSLLMENCNDLWFSYNEKGIYHYKIDTNGISSQIEWYNSQNSALNYFAISGFVRDSLKNLWFRAVGFDMNTFYLIKFDNKAFEIVDSSLGGSPIGTDKSGNLIVTTRDSGLYRVDISSNVWTKFDKNFPKCYVNSMVFDNKDNIWFGSSIGLIKYNENGVDDVKDFANEKGVDIAVTPNPASDYIEITLPACDQTLKGAVEGVRIYDVFGELVNLNSQYSTTPPYGHPFVLEGEFLRVDVSGLAPGLYFVKVGEKVGKFVKM